MYGWGHPERSLSAGLRHAGVEPGDVFIATKWSPLAPGSATSIGRTISERRAALDPYRVDLHQIHMGFGSLSPIAAQIRAMARLADTRTIGAVGVSNFSARQMETCPCGAGRAWPRPRDESGACEPPAPHDRIQRRARCRVTGSVSP